MRLASILPALLIIRMCCRCSNVGSQLISHQVATRSAKSSYKSAWYLSRIFNHIHLNSAELNQRCTFLPEVLRCAWGTFMRNHSGCASLALVFGSLRKRPGFSSSCLSSKVGCLPPSPHRSVWVFYPLSCTGMVSPGERGAPFPLQMYLSLTPQTSPSDHLGCWYSTTNPN